jgi:uncharacterized protein
MNHEEINAYDLGLPVPIAPLEERRSGVPAAVWDRLARAKARLVELLGASLHEVRLFGSYARNQFDDESDVDVLVLTDPISRDEHDRALSALVRLSRDGVYLSPLFLTLADLDGLRAREKLLAQDLDREGIPV